MNKSLLFPFAIMAMLTIISAANGLTGSYTYESPGGGGTIVVNGTNTSVEVPGADTQTFDIWSTEGLLLILGAAIVAGIVAGISFLGSGLSDGSREMIFLSIGLYGTWGAMTVMSYDLLIGANWYLLPQLGWVGMTLIFTLGFIDLAAGGE